MKIAVYRLWLACLWVCGLLHAQSVGIGTPTPHSSARLHIEDNQRGLLIPRLTTTERDGIASPATGLLIYNTDCNRFQYWTGSGWVSLALQASSWCPGSSWPYRLPITISNPNAFPLQNFQVPLLLNTAALVGAGKMQASGADMRFYDATCTLLPHWVESGINTASTRIFVRVPLIPAGGNATIYLYYGNPAAANTASASAVFDFWEDFNGTLGQFTPCLNPSYTLTGGILAYAGGGAFGLLSALPYALNNSSGTNTTGAFLEARVRYAPTNTGSTYGGNLEANSAQFGGCGSNSCGQAVIHYMREVNSQGIFIWIGNGAVNSYNVVPGAFCWTSADNTWYVLSEKILPNQVFFFRDYTSLCNTTGSFTWARDLRWIILGNFECVNANNQDTDYDWVRVRKAAPQDPTHSVGAEEVPSACNQ